MNNGVNLGRSECAVYHASNNSCTQGPTPVNITFTLRSDWTVINERDAKVGVYIDVSGTSLSEVHHIRCQLFDGNGKKLVERYEPTYGVYLYSYAENDSEALSEAEHVIRLLQGHTPQLPVYYDLEDAATVGALSNAQIVSQTNVFCNRLKQAGYDAGVYANDNWWRNRLSALSVSGNRKWLAAWNGGYANQVGNYGLWQFTSDGHVPGINGRVDLDYCLSFDEITAQTHVPVIEEPEPDFILPSALKTIEAEAFTNNAFTYVKLGENVDSIGSRAFADCRNLRHIYIPEKTYPIAANAFEGVPEGFTIHGAAGSYAEFYAEKSGYQFCAE